MFTYPCPHCSQRLLAPPERVGQRTMCPKCLKPLIIPTQEQAARDLAAEVDDPTDPGDGSIFSNDQSPSTDTPLEHPPPEPPSDLRPTTAAWLILTVAGVTLWLVGIVYEAQTLAFVALVGVLLAALSYLWLGYLAGRRGHLPRGLVTLLPPVAAYRYIVPHGKHGYRPLIGLLTGLAFLGMAYTGTATRNAVQQAFAGIEPSAPPVPIVTTSEPADKVRMVVQRNQPELLPLFLAEWSQPDVVRKASPEAKQEMVAELTKLLATDHPTVRTAALSSLIVWSPESAKAPTLAALKSSDSAERRAALHLVTRWPDAETGAAIAELAKRSVESGEKLQILDVLQTLGRPHAEPALLQLLDSDNPVHTLAVLDLLEKCGSKISVAPIRTLSASASNVTVRDEANRVATFLEAKATEKP